MTTYYLSPISTILQYFSNAGVVLNGGKINTYLAGTSTPVATYTDSTGLSANANPIILNSAGRLNAVMIWQAQGVAIKAVFTDASNNILATWDQLQGINDITNFASEFDNPASGSGADLVANAVRSYDVFATARAANVPNLQTGQTLIVIFEGAVNIADGMGGAFYWNAVSTASDDGLNILAPTGATQGRYIRVAQNLALTAVKGNTTSRASTTSVTADPDLSVTLPLTGTYTIEGWLHDGTGTSSGGLKGEISFSGTAVNGYWAMEGSGTGVTAVGLTALGTAVEMQSAQTGVGSMRLSGTLQVSAVGTVTFLWAQNSSNSTASVVGAGSWLKLTRLSGTTGSFTPTTHTFSAAGSFTETIPQGATTATIEAWGDGGAGNTGHGTGCGATYGSGGGSGGYCLTIVNVASANGQTIAGNNGPGGVPGVSSGNGSGTTVSSGSFSLATMSAGGGKGGAPGLGGLGGAGGTASGGNTTNTSGNAGANAGTGTGGGGIAGINGTGNSGGGGGLGATSPGDSGGVGKVIIKYT